MVWAFSLYDINNDGVISKSEMLTILKAISTVIPARLQFIVTLGIPGLALVQNRTSPRKSILNCLIEVGTSDPEKVVDEIFVRMDLDGNGTLSKSEFIIGGMLSIKKKMPV